MKKTLSLTIAILFLLILPINALAATTLNEKQLGAANYLYGKKDTFSVEESSGLLTLIRSNSNASSYKNNYIESVKNELDINSGKLLLYGQESTYLYALVIACLNEFEVDTENFNGYNLNDLFLNSDITLIDSVYYYREIFEICVKINAPTNFTKDILNQLLAGYTLNQGYNYWGYGCDNTAHFLSSLGIVKNLFSREISEYANDAFILLEEYKTENGYFYDAQYGTDANANSTACVLMAYSIWENEKSHEIYDMLSKFESTNTGVYTYEGDESEFSTKDALTAFYYYQNFYTEPTEKQTENNEQTTKEKPQTTKTKTENVQSDSKKQIKSPNTGVITTSIPTAIFSAAIAVFALSRKKHTS